MQMMMTKTKMMMRRRRRKQKWRVLEEADITSWPRQMI